MAKKPSVTTVASGYQGTTTLNTNFSNLRDGFDNTLSLDGSTPNAMLADLDLNSYDIINVNEISTESLFVNNVPVDPQQYSNLNNAVTSAQNSADDAAIYAALAGARADDVSAIAGFRDFSDIATLLANTTLSYSEVVALLGGDVDGVGMDFAGDAYAIQIDSSGANQTVVVNEVIRTRSEGFSYKVAPVNATDHHLVTASGIKLYVLPGLNGYNIKAFNAIGNGIANDTVAISKWLAHIVAVDGTGIVPAGTYRFTSALTGGIGSNWSIIGDGSSVVTFLYDGASTTTDIWTMGDGVANLINIKLEGFKLKSNVTMTSGIGLHLRRVCRSFLFDVIIDGQDGNGNLWHGIRFNSLDNVFYNRFEVRAQKDGIQVNGVAGSGPKADLHITDYKIASCDVGMRVGGAFGGLYTGSGTFAVCGDSVIIDTTLVSEINREVFFSDQLAIDASTRCNVIIDQALAGQLYVNFPSGMWVASSASHGIWIKNANGAKININAYIYNCGGDGVRIDDANAFVTINSFFNTIPNAGTYAINETVATTRVVLGSENRFLNCPNPFNYTSNRAAFKSPFPIGVQTGRAIYWDTYNGTLDGSGNISFAHGKGSGYSAKVIAVFASAKSTGGAWYPLVTNFIDGSNISITGSVPFASRPYNVMCLVGDENNTGW